MLSEEHRSVGSNGSIFCSTLQTTASIMALILLTYGVTIRVTVLSGSYEDVSIGSTRIAGRPNSRSETETFVTVSAPPASEAIGTSIPL